jgi:hypothetical protein
VEKDGEVDGHHKALLTVSSNWCELAADGTVWRKAIYWYEIAIWS